MKTFAIAFVCVFLVGSGLPMASERRRPPTPGS
jgi:hypothetical protein